MFIWGQLIGSVSNVRFMTETGRISWDQAEILMTMIKKYSYQIHFTAIPAVNGILPGEKLNKAVQRIPCMIKVGIPKIKPQSTVV